MKKQVLIVACVLGILCALVLPAFAEDRPEYEYTIAYFASDLNEFVEHYPYEPLNLSRPLVLAGQTWTPSQTIYFNFADYNNLIIGEYNPEVESDPDVDWFKRYEYITVNDLPIVFYSYNSSFDLQDSDADLVGTLVVPETTPPETTSAPSAFGGSVSDGVSSSVGFAGQVLDFIVDSPILIFVGVAVGVFLAGWGISKVKDLVKGY